MKNRILTSGIITSLVLICGILTYGEIRKKEKASSNLENLIANCLKNNNLNYSIHDKSDSNDKTTIMTEQDGI